MKNCDLRMNRYPTAGVEGEGMFRGWSRTLEQRERSGQGLRPASEADPRMSCRAGRVHDTGLVTVWAAQCSGIQDLSSSSGDRTHAPCIPMLPALGVWSLNHWTARRVLTELS